MNVLIFNCLLENINIYYVFLFTYSYFPCLISSWILFPFLLQNNFSKTSGNPCETLRALRLSLAVPKFTLTLVYSPCYS